MNWKFWKKDLPDIQFADVTRIAYTMHPIELAKDVKPHFYNHQMATYGKYLFAHCPGMIDLAQYGYIIPAWDDIHIISNKAGTSVYLGGSKKRQSPFQAPRPMDPKISDGIFKPEYDGLAQPVHLGCPWAVVVRKKNISAFILPATYHSPFLDDLYVYPGVADYGKFTTVNFIFAAKRECRLTIKAGTPLLHVVPFEANGIRAGFGPANDYEKDMNNSIFATANQWYRKYVKRSKPTTLFESYDQVGRSS